jgi:hypothetical protein
LTKIKLNNKIELLEDLMNKIVLVIILVLTVGVLSSCVSMEARQMGLEERRDAQVVGSVTASWTSYHFLHIKPSQRTLENKAISELRAEAQRQGFTGNIEIRNISVAGSFTGLALIYPVSPLFGNFQKVTASGDVVMLSSDPRRTNMRGVEGALERAAAEIAENFTARSRVAIVYITAQDRGTTEYITGELEHILRRRGYIIIDRSELERVRAEQRFGASGEVDDNTAARIGNIAGASIVITGRVDGEGDLRRLRLRALDTSTAQVVGTASERL